MSERSAVEGVVRVETWEAALALAFSAHQGQTYETADGPVPYMLHVVFVAMRVRREAWPIAFLHDVREDTDVEFEVPPRWDAALDLLTRREGEAYSAYIDRIDQAAGWGGDIAREVKVADLLENLSHILPGHRESLRRRYVDALDTLRMLPF